MKKTILLALFGLLIFNYSYGQEKENYSELINDAWNLYNSKDYLKSAKKYSDAFASKGNKGQTSDRYDAACSWALAGEIDSAFVQLFKIATKGNYTNYNHITIDSDLTILHSQKKWSEVIGIINKNKEKAEINLDKPLVVILDTIFQEDQKYRMQINIIDKKYGWESNEMKALWKIINEKDSINLIAIQKILDERGWLGADSIGEQGNSTLFLVIQHSDIKIQEKYLPLMRDAVKKGNAKSKSLALLEDRVALRQGKSQIYGSQIGKDNETGIYEVQPLLDPVNVNKRREKMGLGKLEDYIKLWEIKWNVDEYIKSLPSLKYKYMVKD
tara:strand:- start:1492 stop:2475 length:984 start_codon:yes stop_codon:yes gene_type:complete